MKREAIEYAPGQVAWIVAGETPVLPAQRNALQRSRMSVDTALRNMADDTTGGPLDEVLGAKGPLVAARAGIENAGNREAALFEAMFGRDSLFIASFLPYRKLKRETLKYWAAREGRKFDPRTHEQPGGRMHEERPEGDPQRQYLEERGYFCPNYGTIDAPLLWCISYLEQLHDDPGFARTKLTHFRDGDEFEIHRAYENTMAMLERWQEVTPQNPEGLVQTEAIAGTHQSFPFWKDSPDAYHHKDGSLASPPVCSVETMAYLYDVYAMSGQTDKAQAIQDKLIAHFWVETTNETPGFFALGTDRDPATGALRKLEIKTSNMGHLLDSGILEGAAMERYRNAVVWHLMSPKMLCPAGIRTLANDEVRFDPNAYHNGSVWPFDTFKIARGLLRHGMPELAERLYESIERDCQGFMPELVPGTNATRVSPHQWIMRVITTNVYGKSIEHTRISSPQPVQGWTAAALKAVFLTRDLVHQAVLHNAREPKSSTAFAQQLRESVDRRIPRFVPDQDQGMEHARVLAAGSDS